MEWNYLSLRFWIGLWSCLILLIIVAFDLSALVKYITRFTEESFAFLIAAIFIVEAFTKVLNIQDDYPVNKNYDFIPDYTCTCFPGNTSNSNRSSLHQELFTNNDTVGQTTPYSFGNNVTDSAMDITTYLPSMLEKYANYTKKECKTVGGILRGPGCDLTVHYKDNIYYFSLLLFLGTFTVAMYLKGFRNYKFFPAIVKSVLSDFSVMISILIFCLVDYFIGLKTPKLEVPETFRVS